MTHHRRPPSGKTESHRIEAAAVQMRLRATERHHVVEYQPREFRSVARRHGVEKGLVLALIPSTVMREGGDVAEIIEQSPTVRFNPPLFELIRQFVLRILLHLGNV